MKRNPLIRLTREELQRLQKIVVSKTNDEIVILRAMILIKSDSNTTGWKATTVAEVLECSPIVVRRIRHLMRCWGIDVALSGQSPERERNLCVMTEEQEQILLKLWRGDPPIVQRKWTLRSLAAAAREMGMGESISYETVRTLLKVHGEPTKWRAYLFATKPRNQR